MRYTFKHSCGWTESICASIKDGPPSKVACICGRGDMERDWQSDAPMLDTSKCRDASEVKPQFQTRSAWDRGSPEKIEGQFQKQVHSRRKEIRDAGGQRGSIRQTHSVPAHLYHGKIRETGDKHYWSDPSNLARHKECKVDD